MQGTHRVHIGVDIKQLDKNGTEMYNRGLSVQFGREIVCNGIKDAVEIIEKFEELAKTVGMAEEFDRNV